MSSFFEDTKAEKTKQFAKKYWWIGLIIFGVPLIGLLIWALVATDTVPANVKNKYWKRTTDVLEYRWVNESQRSTSSYPDAPAGSRNIGYYSWNETIHDPAELIRATYRPYKTNYKTTYEIQRWVFDCELALEGNNDQPVWPKYNWDEKHKPGQKFQKFVYTFLLDNKNKEIKTFENNDEVLYGKIAQDDPFILSINKLGAVLKIKHVSDNDIISFEVK